MTIPTFEGGEIPSELSIEMPQEGSSSVLMHVPPEMQSIRLLAGTIFTFIKAPQLHNQMQQPPTHKVHQHNVVTQLISKFNPSIIQLAVLSHQSQVPAKVEKPATVSPPKESSNQRDEAAAKTTGKDLVSIEVFASEESQSQQNPSGQQGAPKSAEGSKSATSTAEAKAGSEPIPLASTAKLVEQKPSSLAADKPAVPQAEKKSAEGKPTQAKSETALPGSKAVEAKPSAAKPASEKSAEPASPEAKTAANTGASKQPTESKPSSEKPASPAEQPSSSAPSSTAEQRQAPQKEAVSTKAEAIEKLSVEGPKASGASFTAKAAQSEAPQPGPAPSKAETAASPKSEPTVHPQALSRVESKEAVAKPPSAEKVPEKNEKMVEPLHYKKEPLPLAHGGDKPKVEEAAKHHHEETRPLPVAADPQLVRRASEESSNVSQLRVFQTLDRNVNIQIPPWLAMLLPDLDKAESTRGKGGGGKAGAVIQNPYKLSDMLFILLCAHLGGAKSLVEVIRFMEAREKWLTVILGLRHGLPPRQLFFWLLVTLDAKAFDYTVRTWLREIQGSAKEQALLLDVVMWQTPLGFIIGQNKHPDAKFGIQNALRLADGFLLENCVAMAKSESSYGSLLSKIGQRGGKYLAEVDEELIPADEHERFESYLEGQERIIVLEWLPEGYAEMQLKVQCEVFDPRGPVHTERFYISSLDNPADYYFDLFRLQRPCENKLVWLLNIALSLPSIDASIERCNASLEQFRRYAEELIAHGGDVRSVQKQMQQAAEDNNFLLQLTRL